jgi:NitT/TauT family transport system ATP-binding protein/sulfonate transport system ATP-binding protein
VLIRGKLQEDLIEIWQTTKLTILFVTHSVEEAVLPGPAERSGR